MQVGTRCEAGCGTHGCGVFTFISAMLALKSARRGLLVHPTENALLPEKAQMFAGRSRACRFPKTEDIAERSPQVGADPQC